MSIIKELEELKRKISQLEKECRFRPDSIELIELKGKYYAITGCKKITDFIKEVDEE